MATPAYTLNGWQSQLFLDLVDLWEKVTVMTAAGRPGQPVWIRRFESVPCFLTLTPNNSEPSDVGRVQQDSVFTLDEFWFHQDQNLGDGWAAVVKTIRPDGARSNNYGRCWITHGGTRNWEDVGAMQFGHVEVPATLQPKAPDGVTV